MVDVFDRKRVYQPTELPDLYGKITCLEALPGGNVRVWICERTMGIAVSRIVLSAWDMIQIRPSIGAWLASHGYRDRPLIIHTLLWAILPVLT